MQSSRKAKRNKEIHMELKKLNKSDARAYQILRLEALALHPEAYGSSYEEESQFSIEVFEQRLENPEHFTYGALIGQELVGVITLITSQRKKTKHNASIVAMYVKEKARRQGIAGALLHRAIDQAKRKSIINLYLTVTTSNLPAKQLYQSFGFETYGIEKNGLCIESIYYDSELMVLYVS
jgi:ribosomal protein S18 acetylase RimI-like enzyme